MTGVINGFRWALLGSGEEPGFIFLISIGIVLFGLISGAYVFRRTEKTIVDVRMSDIVINVRKLGKRYRIGKRMESSNGGRAVVKTISNQFRYLLSTLREPSPDEILWAIKDISFEVKQGEILGIIGRNGAGKSTLLKILCRITEPTEGKAILHGRVGSLLEVGTGFHPELTGRENIYLNGAILGMKRQEVQQKFDEIVDFSGVEKFLDTPVKRYSSGMYVRLAFAVAAHLEPEILLVDEVLAVGDAAFQRKSLGKMGEVAKQGRTVLFVSHNMAMIENLCSSAFLLHNGSVIREGKPREVIREYLDNISTPPNKELNGEIDRKGRGEININALEFFDRQGKLVEYPVSGQDLIIRLHYHSKVDKVFNNCKFDLAISKDQRPYINLSTELVTSRQIDLQGDGYIDFILPELPLSESSYSLSTYIESNGEMQDWVLNGPVLPVIDGNYYGSGKNYVNDWKGRTVLVKYDVRFSNGITGEED